MRCCHEWPASVTVAWALSPSPTSIESLRVRCSGGSSPIPSRNRTPRARSNAPRRRPNAPVNNPASCPYSSESTTPLAGAAQFTVTMGISGKPARLISSAASCFPVPVSPRMRVVHGHRLAGEARELPRCRSETGERRAAGARVQQCRIPNLRLRHTPRIQRRRGLGTPLRARSR
jgi:hypothetical protein